jgi:hypothetical protein
MKGINMQRLATLFFTLLFVSVVQVQAQDKAPAATPDAELIKQTALDYIEGFYEADAARMERSLHPELAKRIVRTDQRGRNSLGQMSALTLVNATRTRDEKTPKDKQQKDVTVLDIFGNAASAKIVATDWIDYLHLAKWNGRWVIVNVLWETKPAPAVTAK